MIKPLEQNYTQSCGLCALAMLTGVKMSKAAEGQLLLNGLKKKYLDYHPGVLSEFVNKYHVKLKVIVEFEQYKKHLKKMLKDNEYIQVSGGEISLVNLKRWSKNKPILVYLDAKYLEYEYYADHAGHYIVLEKIESNQATIVDPWEGKRKEIKVSSLLKCIASLKKQFKYTPLVVTLIKV